MNLPTKPESVAHVSDAHWEKALEKAHPKWFNIRGLAGFDLIADHARCLILLGEVQEPADPISDAIKAASADAIDLVCRDYHTNFETLCRKHFAGLTFPKGDGL